MKNEKNNRHKKLDFYQEIVTAYENMLTEIDFLVEGSFVFAEYKGDPRKILLDEYLHTLRNKMDLIIAESTKRYLLQKEVEERYQESEIDFGCDACGAPVDTRVGIMKWHDDEKPATPEDWMLLEKFNDFLDIPVRWVTFCTNPNCGKMWKEGMFEIEVSEPKIKTIKDKIRNNILNERGFNK